MAVRLMKQLAIRLSRYTTSSSRWLYRRWERRHEDFLKERSYGEPTGENELGGTTHRNFRAARSLLRNALPHLFTSSTTHMCHEQRIMLKAG